MWEEEEQTGTVTEVPGFGNPYSGQPMTSHGQPSKAHAKWEVHAIPGDPQATSGVWLKRAPIVKSEKPFLCGRLCLCSPLLQAPPLPSTGDSHNVLFLVLLCHTDAFTAFLQLVGCHLAQNLHVLDEVQL